jgi:Histidine kinase-, DNA gyrase B-, and HSP90-like ATPase
MTKEEKLVREIKAKLDNGKVSEATLTTDDRVLGRITDGIYRQPASALRELIANAYDADATNVYVETDWPKFSRISVRDDGNGMTIEALASLINHIGGSPKRTKAGVEKGIVNEDDPSLSPGGRRLIGKIGIGLFSVAQLTRHFQIITKARNTSHRLVAEVTLKTYSEEELAELADQDDVNHETGTVRIRSYPAENKKEHGTEIILLNIRPQTKDLLRSKEVWARTESEDPEVQAAAVTPTYHIGRLEPGSEDILSVPENLPWDKDDPAEKRFAKLYQAIINEVGVSVANPKLETILDYYLRVLWTLSLSAPIDYIEKHPFDLTTKDDPSIYLLNNSSKGQASKVTLKKDETIRQKLGLTAPERGNQAPFHIFVDEVELRRPIRFNNLPSTSQAITKPIIFVGRHTPDLSKIPKEIRGGDLSFEGYFLWTPKVVPKENKGLLVRISDASGTGFDETFAKYQISEQTRLNQITAEVFVIKGVDPALNIDRESFNFAHPHYQLLMTWVHSALRQVANTHKALSSIVRSAEKEKKQGARTREVEKKVAAELEKAGIDPDIDAPEVVFAESNKQKLKEMRAEGVLAFEADVIFAPVPQPARQTATNRAERELLEEKIKGVAAILDAYGVLKDLSYDKQQQLLQSIVSIFVSGE